ncbi:MAG: hypothetical protein E7042_06035 [Lentisphaerae bacterium]|nr:hypothetical protein [Lentisphaerota bacterium]
MNRTRALKIYFAGDLFDHKDLAGNLLLANAVERLSGNRYQLLLPQDGECEVVSRTSQSIRDEDFKLLFNSDLLIANFDGTDLDSGTVVEFCFAKMVDMPTVLLRTDFRDSGDHTLPDGEPWNLMCSHFPRTEVLYLNAMARYHECRKNAGKAEDLLTGFYTSIASDVVNALDRVCQQKSWLGANELSRQYHAALKSVGGSVEAAFPDEAFEQLIASKSATGLFQ